jgi:hypothetical protein
MKQRTARNICPTNSPPQSCSAIFPRNVEPFFPIQPTQEIITDEISGFIQQQSDSRPVQYWKWLDNTNLPSASLTITSSCYSDMTVYVDTSGNGQNDLVLFTISEYGQSRSASLPRIASLEVVCSGQTELCTGRYGLVIHYTKR